jgi:hypothetical protein
MYLLKKSKKHLIKKQGAGRVYIGYPETTNAALDSQKHGRIRGGLRLDASFLTMERKVLERMNRGPGRWIELLEHGFGEEPLYRACGQNGAMCRYTNDLWQAEIYVQYY